MLEKDGAVDKENSKLPNMIIKSQTHNMHAKTIVIGMGIWSGQVMDCVSQCNDTNLFLTVFLQYNNQVWKDNPYCVM